ncbi:DUF411 domain-containing protein [Pararhizobium sp. YC-54]|uniref:DUF411 domain-containing protein n=1 Tax=Pararhizobium sp. YC-54 TaxID=2986920 RepID=UPI0021F7388B|nr:DUF411 domain-containing protein [Pararhizobium sp. YC-54]MCV9997449.1 DUF411 domain-containing protein [Pararhizobium sp. YC-54]
MRRRELLCSVIAAGSFAVVGRAQAARERMVVYKDPNCGCCHAWAEAMAKAGFSVKAEDVADIDAVKDRYKVPGDLRGCHTALVAGYYLEGHVPLEALTRLLTEKPDLAGLSVPGMPAGSLGMGDDPDASYDVIAIGKDGTSRVYQAVRPKG